MSRAGMWWCCRAIPSTSPVPGAIIDLEALDGQPNAAIESLRRTDADGRYQLALASGRWIVTISADGFTPERVKLDVPNDGTVVRDVVLTPA